MKLSYLGVFILFLFSCAQQESKQLDTPIYFDLSKYFNQEAARLQKGNPTIIKSVTALAKAEQKATKITDWKTELASFSNADINKASWKGEFTETNNTGNVSYATTNPKIPIKKIEIVSINNKVKSVKIFKATKNYLYTSKDTLIYYPDSLYFIQNLQNIKLLGDKKYQVTGKFK